MTRKDYILIAEALKAARPLPHWDRNKEAQWVVTFSRLADRLIEDNPRFDFNTFKKACGL
jgi:hypothetical protein